MGIENFVSITSVNDLENLNMKNARRQMKSASLMGVRYSLLSQLSLCVA